MWRMIPSFNPSPVSSERDQDLHSEARQFLFQSGRNDDVSEEELEDTSPMDIAEGAGALGIEDEHDDDAADQVCYSGCSSVDDANLA